jgi:hypothetical protein
MGIARDVVLEGETGFIVENTDAVGPWIRTLNEVLKTNMLEKIQANAANRKKFFC